MIINYNSISQRLVEKHLHVDDMQPVRVNNLSILQRSTALSRRYNQQKESIFRNQGRRKQSATKNKVQIGAEVFYTIIQQTFVHTRLWSHVCILSPISLGLRLRRF